ncbi:MAG TPA: DUF1003 domain-containing protein [Pirellula sp.]|nr:DUF1003 domain-containing protein [Pirellula sp.]
MVQVDYGLQIVYYSDRIPPCAKTRFGLTQHFSALDRNRNLFEFEAGEPQWKHVVMPSSSLSASAKKNVEAIAQLEQQLHGRRSRVEKIGEQIARYFGSLWFIAAHAVFFTAWIVANARVVPGVDAFDPYPFPFLGFVIGIEFIFLTSFVLMNQNLQSKRQEHWGHLTLQVALLTEQEVTKSMQMLHLICQNLGLEKPSTDEESNDLAQPTPLTELVEEIEKAREVGDTVAESDSVRHGGQ